MNKLLTIFLIGTLFSCTNSNENDESFKFEPSSTEVRYFEGTNDTFQIVETNEYGNSNFQEYYPNGQLKVSGSYGKGIKCDEWRTFYLDDWGKYIHENFDKTERFGFGDTIVSYGLTI